MYTQRPVLGNTGHEGLDKQVLLSTTLNIKVKLYIIISSYIIIMKTLVFFINENAKVVLFSKLT